VNTARAGGRIEVRTYDRQAAGLKLGQHADVTLDYWFE
jgi:hypothetical protein